METLVVTMTNYFGTKRLRFTVNCIELIKIYNERHDCRICKKKYNTN